MMEEKKITRYAADEENNFFKVVRQLMVDFPAAASLGYRIATRNIKSQYRQSIFGILWAFLPPLATAGIWILLKSQGVSSFSSGTVPYPLFVLVGTLLWQIFSQSVLLPLKAIGNNKNLLRKINFPRESLIYGAFFEALFNLFLNLIIISVVFIYYQDYLGIEASALSFIPLTIGLMILGFVIAVFLIPVASLFNDIQLGIPVLLQFMIYLTPVLYETPIYSGPGSILSYNPVSPLLTSARNFLLGTPVDYDISFFIIYGATLIALLLAGLVIMKVVMRILIERMGS